MRRIALLGLGLAMIASVGCRGTLNRFRGALCRPSCGLALPAPVAPGCAGCGPVTSGYGSYDGGIVGDTGIVGSDYYGGEYYGGSVIPSAPSEGQLSAPMTDLNNPN